jgi:hypothetical protein
LGPTPQLNGVGKSYSWWADKRVPFSDGFHTYDGVDGGVAVSFFLCSLFFWGMFSRSGGGEGVFFRGGGSFFCFDVEVQDGAVAEGG